MTYVIGEIGQNHNGSTDLAKVIIDLITKPRKEGYFDIPFKGMDAIKLTKRDLKYELSDSQMNRPYNNPNSFGKTYGEHRDFLELNDEEHFEIYLHAKSKGLDFVETLCAPSCLSMLKFFTPDKLKVASRDLTNLPLLEALAETKLPIILSTGMAGKKELDDALEVLTKFHEDIAILHCVSEYPTQPKNTNLNTIPYLKKLYPQYTIGYSDHTIGITAPVVAMSLGAEIIEKHITLDRGMKGTDQAGSLGPEGVYRMMRDIRIIEESMGEEKIFIADSVKTAREKLERSIASNKKLLKGHVITEDDIHLLSPGNGIKWTNREEIIGKTLLTDMPSNEILLMENLK
ncbi:MAG: N-acetylneuraminate synthase family protein [Nonlabens sp.]|uniref:N-acetylneuraminate synthase family protein n=1 Tax=Nonlabens sp. TaxID=1888209 RepID=UPI003EFA42FF